MVAGTKDYNPAKSSTAQPNNGVPPEKVIGPNIQGNREEYQLVRRLQSALFGGVYEAKGLSSGREFAIKVLRKSELIKAEETTSIEFCEVPLSEIRFAELMSGDDHVMEPEEHFEDTYCFYIVFELARGGDLLEALKQKPTGFHEPHAQYLIRQAVKGLAYLHSRQVAMQDVSLENMLLHVDPRSGNFRVKICDPGQAIVFKLDQVGEELPVGFRGLVGKSFRPPELHEQKPYCATKVDSWCLGWSTFYLLSAQPLFMSADPSQQDADWLLFQQGDYTTLFQSKCNLCSHVGLDFIFRLLQLEPQRRMSISDALDHPWLSDPKILPMPVPKELLPESMQKTEKREHEMPTVKDVESNIMDTLGTMLGGAECGTAKRNVGSSVNGHASSGSINWVSSSVELPTWASARTISHSKSPPPAMVRVCSPMATPRISSGALSHSRIPIDRHRCTNYPAGIGTRASYLVATTNSPPPRSVMPTSPARTAARTTIRAASPVKDLLDSTAHNSEIATPARHYRSANFITQPQQQQVVPQSPTDPQKAIRPTFQTPRSGSRPPCSAIPSIGSKIPDSEPAEVDGHVRGRAWAFKSEGVSPNKEKQMGNEILPMQTTGATTAAMPHTKCATSRDVHVRNHVNSPMRSENTIYIPRSSSPFQAENVQANSPSVVSHVRQVMRTPTPSFSWAQAPTTLSPRASFTWSPESFSPRASSRAFSPQPAVAFQKGLAVTGVRAAPIRR